MFGGLHHNDERKRAEHPVRAEKEKTLTGENLAAEVLRRSTHGCRWRSPKSMQVALDTADFVRHVPGFPGFLMCFTVHEPPLTSSATSW